MRPRNIPIDVTQASYREVKIVFSDKPDLSTANILLIVKPYANFNEVLFTKQPNYDLSRLSEGIVFFTFDPQELLNYEPMTYYYEIHVEVDSESYIPLRGDFIVWGSHVQR